MSSLIKGILSRMVKLLYQKVTKVVVTVSSPKVPEITEAFANVFPNVNIALDLSKVVECLAKAGSHAEEC